MTVPINYSIIATNQRVLPRRERGNTRVGCFTTRETQFCSKHAYSSSNTNRKYFRNRRIYTESIRGTNLGTKNLILLLKNMS